MTAPVISCVIPTYSSVALAARCLYSIVTQEGVSLEVIVSDDSPGGEVRAFVETLSQTYPNVAWKPGARTGNPVENWNAGLDHATGKYAVLIHHDEFLIDTGYLARAVAALEAGAGRIVVAAHGRAGGGRPSAFPVIAALARALRAPAWTLYILNWIGPTASVVFPTAASPRFDARLVWKVDSDFYAGLFQAQSDILRDDAISVISLRHGGQITARVSPRRLNLQELRFLQRNKPERMTPWQYRLAIAYATLRALGRA